MKNNGTRKISTFYFVFIICWAVALLSLIIGLVVLHSYLSDYEKAQPKYVAQEVFEKYFSPLDANALAADATPSDTPFDGIESRAEYIKNILPKGAFLSFYNVSTGIDSDTIKYTVKYSVPEISERMKETGNESTGQQKSEIAFKFASFTLKKAKETSKKGFDLYELEKIELNYANTHSVSVKVPFGYTLSINGIKADSNYISELSQNSESCEHMPKGVEGLKHTLYKIDMLLKAPSIIVSTPEGTECEVYFDSESDEYIAKPVNNESLSDAYSEYVINAAKTYATYMQNDTTFAKAAKYFEKGTDLYEAIRKSATMWVIDHDSYEFENISATEFYSYDENTFSCRVRLTHILHRKRLEDFRDTMDVTFYLRKVNGAFLIYDRTNN